MICPSSQADGIVSAAACLMADEQQYARVMGTWGELLGARQQSPGCHFICTVMKWSLFENSKLLFHIYLFFVKKSIMSWHKLLITCPRTQTSRWIGESNKTNSADWLRHNSIKYSVSPTFNCDALLLITVMSMKYSVQMPVHIILSFYRESKICCNSLAVWTGLSIYHATAMHRHALASSTSPRAYLQSDYIFLS